MLIYCWFVTRDTNYSCIKMKALVRLHGVMVHELLDVAKIIVSIIKIKLIELNSYL